MKLNAMAKSHSSIVLNSATAEPTQLFRLKLICCSVIQLVVKATLLKYTGVPIEELQVIVLGSVIRHEKSNFVLPATLHPYVDRIVSRCYEIFSNTQ